MATWDLGDAVTLTYTNRDASGNPADTTTMVATVTLPDGTSATPSVTHGATGIYSTTYTPSQYGRHLIRWVATGANPSGYTDEFSVRDLTRLPVISFSDALTHLNIPTASAATVEEELRRFIDVAEDLAENTVGRVLGRKTFTETYDGNVDHLRLRSPAALSVTSVVENGVTIDSSSYALDPTGQRLLRLQYGQLSGNGYGWWGQGSQNIVVTYTAGYLVIPPSVQQGVLEILRHLWMTQRGAVSVMGLSGASDDMIVGAAYSVPRRALELLDAASFPGVS